jgi:signal transduction histidine kinase/ABC-type nitrate/sulfonate/bicarbonate transport system substrate-binding protein
MNRFKIIILFFSLFTLNYANTQSVTLQLQYKHQFQFAGYYMAIEKGYYEDVNLDVKLLEYKQGNDSLKKVLSGEVNYGIGRSSLIMERSNGKNIVLLRAILQSSPLVMVSKKSSKIDTIEKFKNKRFSVTLNEADSSLYPILLSKNIDKNSINVQKTSNKIDDLLNNKTDIITLYTSNQEYTLIQKGIKYNIFYPKEYGFDFYDDILFTSEKETTQHKTRTINFTNASLLGWQYAFDNIEETVDVILSKYNTQNKTRDELLYEAKTLKKLAFSNGNNLGDIDKNKIQRINDMYHIMGLTKSKINLDKFIFNYSNNKVYLTKEEKVFLKNNQTITMCGNNNWEPITFKDTEQNSNLSGISIDTLTIIEKDLKVKFKYIPTDSWEEAQEYFKNKKCDILPAAAKTFKREEYANFTKPYLKLPLAIFTAKNKPLTTSLPELSDKTWSRQKGSGLITKIKKEYPKMRLVEAKSIKEALALVNQNEVYFTMATLPVASSIIMKYHFDNIQISGYPNITYNLAIAVQKDNMILLNILDKALNQITPKQHSDILKSWSNTSIEYPYINSSLIIKVLLFLAIIALFIFYRQYVLKKSNENLNMLVDNKTQELQELNTSLEHKIAKAIIEKRKQDKILDTQAKMVSMGEMIGNIAHQWRQPLSVISTGVTGMQVQKEYGLLSDEQFNKTCEMINENAQYLSKTIDDFKNFITGDRIKKSFNLTDTFEKFLHLVEGTIKSKNIKVIINAKESSKIKGYENELIQCFINIFNNAKDAQEEQKIENKLIVINTFFKDDKVIIKIQDNGLGIDSHIIDKIFEPYYTTKHMSQGTGLGLHMTYKLIVEGMKGTITANTQTFKYDNISYKGALFTITLPIS